jgi:hypothetical protein
MNSLGTGLSKILAEALTHSVAIPVFLERRDEKVTLPYVVVMLDGLEMVGTGDSAGVANMKIVLATSGYEQDAATHDGYVEAVGTVLDELQTRLNSSGLVYDHDVALLGLCVQSMARTKTGDDARNMTRGDIWEVICGVQRTGDTDDGEPWPDDDADAALDGNEFTADATLSGGRFVHLSGTSVRYASAETSVPAMGFIRGAVASGDVATVVRQGRLDGLVGLTAERDYYLGVNGQITTTPSTATGIIQFVGRSISDTSLIVEIDSPLSIA